METICKKCIERGEKKWSPISIEEYKKIFLKLPWFENTEDENNNNTLINIAGQLQLIEFIEQIHIDCEIYEEESWYDEVTGDNYSDLVSEIGPILEKQIVCAVGAIIEAICYAILRDKKIDFYSMETRTGLRDDTSFASMLSLIKINNLLPENEYKLCYAVKNLRNTTHLFDQIKTDTQIFHWSSRISELTMKCLYLLLRRWLNASDNFMQRFFPFIPKRIIKEPDEETNEILKSITELIKRVESAPSEKPKIYFIQLGSELKLDGKAICEIVCSAGIPMAVPYLENSSKKSLSFQLAIAKKLAFPYALIFGEKEALDKSIIVQNVSNKSEKIMKLDGELLNYLKELK